MSKLTQTYLRVLHLKIMLDESWEVPIEMGNKGVIVTLQGKYPENGEGRWSVEWSEEVVGGEATEIHDVDDLCSVVHNWGEGVERAISLWNIRQVKGPRICMKEKEKWGLFERNFVKNQGVNMPTHEKEVKFPVIMDASQSMQMILDLEWYQHNHVVCFS